MADVTLLGVNYPDVPSVILPKTGGGSALFNDTSVTTATASDVASGKIFLSANGEVTTGTASGSAPLKYGVLRPDAEIVKTFSADEMLFEDMEISWPAYTTTSTTLKTGEIIGTYDIGSGVDSYNYAILHRCLSIPIYNTNNIAKARFEYSLSVFFNEIVHSDQGAFSTVISSNVKVPAYNHVSAATSAFRGLYWYNATSLRLISTSGYGISQTYAAPTIDGTVLTINSPNIVCRGSSSYLAQTFWEAIEDIRMQYRIDIYRAPIVSDGVNGWTHSSTFVNIASAANNNWTLT